MIAAVIVHERGIIVSVEGRDVALWSVCLVWTSTEGILLPACVCYGVCRVKHAHVVHVRQV